MARKRDEPVRRKASSAKPSTSAKPNVSAKPNARSTASSSATSSAKSIPRGRPVEAAEPKPAEVDEVAARHRRGAGTGKGLGGTIGGIMHGIDADIFRDPASIQRIKRDRNAVVRTADGTVVGIELPKAKGRKEDLPKDAG
jgi:hypothetical protein